MQVDGKAGPYEFITYAQAGELVAGVGAALVAAGLEARQKCAIYGVNCPEWMIAMQASRFPSMASQRSCGLPCGLLWTGPNCLVSWLAEGVLELRPFA